MTFFRKPHANASRSLVDGKAQLIAAAGYAALLGTLGCETVVEVPDVPVPSASALDGGPFDSSIPSVDGALSSEQDATGGSSADGSLPASEAAIDAESSDAAIDGGPPGIFCQQVGTSCTCSAPDGRPGGGPACSEATVTNAVCCADSTWPAAATSCTCKSFGCTGFSDEGCVCNDTMSSATTTSCLPGTGVTCCASSSTSALSCNCSTSNGSCFGETAVSACSAEVQPCAISQTRVTSCSP